MKLYIYGFFALIFSSTLLFSQSPENIGIDNNGAKYLRKSLVIKLRNGFEQSSVKKQGKNNSREFFGIASLDNALQQNGAEKVKQALSSKTNLPQIRRNNKAAEIEKELRRFYIVEFKEPVKINELIRQISNFPEVELVEKKYIDEQHALPNDPMLGMQQYLPQIQAEMAWNQHKGENGPEIIIGINDSGVQWDHPDLFNNLKINNAEWTNKNQPLFVMQGGRKVINPLAVDGMDSDGNGYIDDVVGWNCVTWDGTAENDPWASPDNKHGTHVAGLAAGVTNNAEGISSINYNVKFVPTKQGENGYGSTGIWNADQGLIYLISYGVDIINMSWGGSSYSDYMRTIFEWGNAMGVLFVGSAGNNNDDIFRLPSSYPHILSIASVASTDAKAYYSSYGYQVDLSAPGGDARVDGGLQSTISGSGYQKFQGTSMASPVAAGLAALIKSKMPNLTNKQIAARLCGTTDDINSQNPNFANKLGSGRINAYKALTSNNLVNPSGLRFGLLNYYVMDENNNGMIEPGETIKIVPYIRNFNEFYSSQNVKFSLICNSSDVSISYLSTFEQPVAEDDIIIRQQGMTAYISDEAKPQILNFKIKAESNDLIIGSGEMDINLVIAGGILVMEPTSNSNYSGTYLKNELTADGFDVIYSNFIPQDLSGFKAVFLNIGNSADQSYYSKLINDFWPAIIYIENGGKMYFECGNAIYDLFIKTYGGFDYLPYYFGISNAIHFNNTMPFTSLAGMSGSVGQGMNFTGTQQTAFQKIERYTMAEPFWGGKAVFDKPDYGITAFQTNGFFGQKLFVSSYTTFSMIDGNCPSTKRVLLDRIVNFFGLLKPLKISSVNVEACYGQPVTLGINNQFDCNTNTWMNKTVSGGSGNFSYSWNPSNVLTNPWSLTPILMNPTGTRYFNLTVTDNITGESTTQAIKVILLERPNLSVPNLVKVNTNFVDLFSYINMPDESYMYYWRNNNGAINEANAAHYSVPYGLHSVYVQAENSYGCKSTEKRIMLYRNPSKDAYEDISAGENGNSVLISYPNPVVDELGIYAEFDEASNSTIKIVDMLGIELFNLNLSHDKSIEQNIDVSKLSKGVYFVIIENEFDKVVRKFVKE